MLEVEEARELITFWKDVAFPEIKLHLQPPGDGKVTRVNEFGDPDTFEVYRAQTITGRIRSKASYCSACNYAFQGLAADGAKLAMWDLWKKGYPMVNFIHDEVVFELKVDDPHLHDKIADIKQTMLDGMRKVLPEVTGLECEGSLMRRWHKEAEEEIDPVSGLTLIYDDIMMCAPPDAPPKKKYDFALWEFLKAKHGEKYTVERPELV